MYFYALDLAGVAVFAASGVLAARDRDLDLFGILTVAILTAVGGGTLRDVLLDRHPIFWITDPWYLVVIVVATMFTILYLRVRPAPGAIFLWADAFGLAFFAMSGASLAYAGGHPPLIVIVMGTMTGVVGGVLRDVITAHVPLVMRQEIYAIAAIAGIGGYLVLLEVGVPHGVAFGSGVVVVIVLRVLAIRLGLHLPSLRTR